jgi:capsular polysaccharide biosynthesis protein
MRAMPSLAAMQRRLSEGLTASVQAETSLSTLERQRLLAQERYNEVQKKLDQIKLYLRLDPSDAESRVIVDQPSRPQANEGKRKPLIVLAGPVAGLLLGLLLAGLRELFDQRLQSRRDVMTRLGLPVLGALPRLSSSERQRLAGMPR